MFLITIKLKLASFILSFLFLSFFFLITWNEEAEKASIKDNMACLVKRRRNGLIFSKGKLSHFCRYWTGVLLFQKNKEISPRSKVNANLKRLENEVLLCFKEDGGFCDYWQSNKPSISRHGKWNFAPPHPLIE